MNTYDVTSSFVQTVDADRAEAREVLARIEPMRSLADRLSALGLDDRAIWSETGELAYTLVWRFAEGHARLDWRITVDADGAGRTMLDRQARSPRQRPRSQSPPARRMDVARRTGPGPYPPPGPHARRLRERGRLQRRTCWKRRRQSRRRPAGQTRGPPAGCRLERAPIPFGPRGRRGSSGGEPVLTITLFVSR